LALAPGEQGFYFTKCLNPDNQKKIKGGSSSINPFLDEVNKCRTKAL
jgi:hypothetical protein